MWNCKYKQNRRANYLVKYLARALMSAPNVPRRGLLVLLLYRGGATMIGQKVGDKLKEVIVGRQMSEVIVSIFFGALSYKVFISSISIG